MIIKDPLNVKPLNPDEYFDKYKMEGISREVTTQLIFEPSSTKFHSEGLYSEEIFGQIGSEARLHRLGYINLNTKVFAPLVFKNIKDLKPIYIDILSGKQYAKFNEKTKEFDFYTKDTPDAETGYSFFVKYFDQLKFKETGSGTTSNKIKMINLAKTSNSALVDKCMILPAGVRDIKYKNDRLAVEDINKLYNSILALAEGLKFNITGTSMEKFYDGLRFNVQNKLYEIYEYVNNYFTGKHGFGQGKYTGRSVTYGTRNVISTSDMLAKTPDHPGYLKSDETLVPLFQACKMYQPLLIHELRTKYYGTVFTYGTTQASVLDPDTFERVFVEVDDKEVTKYMGSEFYESLINKFQDTSFRNKPVTITSKDGKEYYLNMIYDLDHIVYIAGSMTSFKSSAKLNMSSITKVTDFPLLGVLESSGIDRNKLFLSTESSTDVWLNRPKQRLKFITDKETRDILHSYFDSIGFSISLTKGTPSIIYAKSPNDEIIEFTTLSSSESPMEDIISKMTTKVNGYNVLKPESIIKVEKDTFDKKTISDLKSIVDNGFVMYKDKLRPMTYLEMFYIAATVVTLDKYATVTRYPAIELGSIYVSKIKIGSTVPSKEVTLQWYMGSGPEASLFTTYPIINKSETGELITSSYLDSLIVHPSQLHGLGGDFDGDMLNCNGIMSKNANKECEEHLDSDISMITTSGTFLKTGETNMTGLTLFNLTR